MTMLQWSLVIATLNRHPVLRKALETALRQTRPPAEIIVVDASADFAACRDDVLRSFAAERPEIRWIYLPSTERSLTYQRNVGLREVTCPVAFFFDDDTLLFPDCAEEIMRTYERDTAGELGGIAAALHPLSPLDAPATTLDTPDARPAARQRMKDKLRDLVLAPWDQHRLFIPYDGTYHARMPDSLQSDPALAPEALFHGCRMTFRTCAIRRAGGFSEVLTRHCFGEDIDASYRVSRALALIVNHRARVHHAMAPASRARRRAQATLVILNAAVLFSMYRNPALGLRRQVWRFVFTRLMVEFARDSLKPWRRYPNFQGVWRAMRALPRFLRATTAELRAIYPAYQQELIDGPLPTRLARS